MADDNIVRVTMIIEGDQKEIDKAINNFESDLLDRGASVREAWQEKV